MTHADVTRFLHSRYAVAMAAIVAVVGVMSVLSVGNIAYPTVDASLVAGWGGQWIADARLNLWVALAVNAGIAALLIYLNKIYNVLRAMTMLQATFFLVMQMSTPSTMMYLTPGLVLCTVALLCVYLMYSSYSDARGLRSVFLVFALLSGCSTFNYAFLIYIPVFALACVQMRIFSLRAVLAMLMGIATPWIIILGFGIVSPDQISFSALQFNMIDVRLPGAPALIATVLFTCFLTLAAWLQNVLKILTYNARSRALQSIVSVLTLVTIVAILINNANATAYLPLLNLCGALQIGHLFGSVHTQERSYMAIISIMLIYLLIFAWRILIYIL